MLTQTRRMVPQLLNIIVKLKIMFLDVNLLKAITQKSQIIDKENHILFFRKEFVKLVFWVIVHALN